jgi:hypothetical protein
MHAGFSFSYSPISVLLRQPLSIKKSYAEAIQMTTYTLLSSSVIPSLQLGIHPACIFRTVGGWALLVQNEYRKALKLCSFMKNLINFLIFNAKCCSTLFAFSVKKATPLILFYKPHPFQSVFRLNICTIELYIKKIYKRGNNKIGAL